MRPERSEKTQWHAPVPVVPPALRLVEPPIPMRGPHLRLRWLLRNDGGITARWRVAEASPQQGPLPLTEVEARQLIDWLSGPLADELERNRFEEALLQVLENGEPQVLRLPAALLWRLTGSAGAAKAEVRHIVTIYPYGLDIRGKEGQLLDLVVW